MLYRLLLALSLAVLLVGAMATGVGAVNGSSRQPLPPPGPAFQNCGTFSVLTTWPRWNLSITVTNLPDGTTVIFESGSATATLTNETSLKSINLNAGGGTFITIHPDGSVLANFTGVTLFEAVPPSQATEFGVPLLAVFDGNLQLTSDPSGDTTSLTHTGRVTDLCAVLS